jgi:hypothetical protein
MEVSYLDQGTLVDCVIVRSGLVGSLELLRGRTRCNSGDVTTTAPLQIAATYQPTWKGSFAPLPT